MKWPDDRSRPALSPPSRGAWIEIAIVFVWVMIQRVAPLAGGVD